MAPSRPAAGAAGFTLIEVLASLGLCALLATAAAGAVAFAARAERLAARDGEAGLLLQSLYAAQRLRPDDAPAAPRDWLVARDETIVPRPTSPPRLARWPCATKTGEADLSFPDFGHAP
jgi:prepilin-type N-terminal cleavage/methylation domain-containing protein